MGQFTSKIARGTVEAEHRPANPQHAATNSAQTNDYRDFRFLSLPAEIRVMIYNYVLLSNGDIEMRVPYPEQPGLLQVNREVRSEALDIYYKKNKFFWSIRDFNASAYIKWCQSSRCRLESRTAWHFHGKRHWGNLLLWLRAYYDCKVLGPGKLRPGYGASPRDRSLVTTELFPMVRSMRKQNLTWGQVVHLEHARELLTAVGKKWEQEAVV